MLTILKGCDQFGVAWLALDGFVEGRQKEFVLRIFSQIGHHMGLRSGIKHCDDIILRRVGASIPIAYVQALGNT